MFSILLLIFSVGIIAQPTITSFSPTTGPVGTSVTLFGTNFSSTPSNNIVFFGATQATVTAALTTELTVTVPEGSTYQPISVMTNGLVSFSKNAFAVTFDAFDFNQNNYLSKGPFATNKKGIHFTIGDLDGDGKSDLIASNLTAAIVSILRNTSTESEVSFAPKQDFSISAWCQEVATADLDNDGKLDLIAGISNLSFITIYRNNSTVGAISLTDRLDLPTGTNGAFRITTGDFDADGKVDLASVNFNDQKITVFRNESTGPGDLAFAAGEDFGTVNGGRGLIAYDFDQDGLTDMAAAKAGPSNVLLFHNTSAGVADINFSSEMGPETVSDGVSLVAGDLDGDGWADLVQVNDDDNTISVFENTSTSGTISFADKVDFTVPTTASGIILSHVSIGDLNGDGKPDLAVTNPNGGISAMINRSTGEGVFDFDTPIEFTAGNIPSGGAIGDLNNDGLTDIAVLNYDDTNISVLQFERDLIAYYTFDGDATDKSGNGNDGAVNGATLTTDRFGNANSAYSFDGVDDNISVANNSGDLTFDDEIPFTWTMWVKQNSLTDGFAITNAAATNPEYRVTIRYLVDGRYQLYPGKQGIGNDPIYSESVSLDTWRMVSLVSDGSEISGYLNGTLIGTLQKNLTAGSSENPHGLLIGSYFTTPWHYFDGLIDDIRIYNRALSASEIADLYQEDAFITTWQTTTASEMITIPTTGTGYDYTVDWGDGAVESGFTEDATHTYATAGTYSVAIQGDFPRIYFHEGLEGQHATKIKTIEQWGNIIWSSWSGAFQGCSELTINATDAPDLSTVVTLDAAFRFSGVNQSIDHWDVSNVQDFSHMFGNSSYNQPLNSWELTSATNLQAMFQQSAFDQPLDQWDVSNVQNMSEMFGYSSFNQDISNWVVSDVRFMTAMFINNTSFNQPIGTWDVSNVETFGGSNAAWSGMFKNASSFNQNLSNWDIGVATDMREMFDNSGMSIANYDATLEGWSTISGDETSIPSSITLGATGLEYCDETGRDALIALSWAIIGDSKGEGCALSTKTDFTAFSFSEQTGSATINTNNHTIEIEVNGTATVSNLVATFTLSSGASAKVGSITQESGATSNNFSSPVTYQITAEDGVTSQNWEVTVFVQSINTAPSDIYLTNDIILLDNASAVVGDLSADDPEQDAVTFSLAGGVDDNDSFTISGNELRVGASELSVGNYEVTVTASDGDLTLDETFTIQVKDQSVSGLSFGAAVTNYRMISAPAKSVRVNSFFSAFLDRTKGNDWEVYSYNPSSNTESIMGTNSNLVGGTGYWFLARDQGNVQLPGSTDPVDLNDNGEYEMNLQSGWNLIGNPFRETLNWANEINNNPSNASLSIGTSVQVYTGAYSPASTLPIYGAAFVNVTEPTTVYLRKPNFDGSSRTNRANRTTNNEGWSLDINMTNGYQTTSLGGIGMHNEANDGYDKHDYLVPPPVSEEFVFRWDDGQGIGRNIVAPKDQHIWEYQIKTNSDQVRLFWDSHQVASLNTEVWIELLPQETTVKMNIADEISYYPRANQKIKIYYGSIPDSYLQVFPNPAKDGLTVQFKKEGKTDVEITNIEGWRVFQETNIASIDQLAEWRWDLRTNEGVRVPAGIYLVRINREGLSSRAIKVIVDNE